MRYGCVGILQVIKCPGSRIIIKIVYMSTFYGLALPKFIRFNNTKFANYHIVVPRTYKYDGANEYKTQKPI